MSLIITRSFEPRMLSNLVSWNETDIKSFPNCILLPTVDLVNGDFEGAASPEPVGWSFWFTSFTRQPGTRTGGLGSYVGRIAYDGLHYYGGIFQNVLEEGKSYRLQAWVRGDSSETSFLQIDIDDGTIYSDETLGKDWQFIDVTFFNPSDTIITIFCQNLAAFSRYIELDDIVITCLNVTQFTNLSNDGYHLIQSSGESCPAWVTTSDGGYLSFDGVDDFMQCTIPGFVQPTHGFILLKNWNYTGAPTFLVDGLNESTAAIYQNPENTTNLYAGTNLVGPIWGSGESFILDWEINNNNSFPSSYDSPNNICLNVSYRFNKRLSFSANWVYYTGDAITTPIGFYYYNGASVPLYGNKNNDRLPDYHRLDISITYKLSKPERRYQHTLIFTVYNLYAHKNPISVNFNKAIDDNGDFVVPSNLNGGYDLVPSTLSMVDIIPSITYTFKFR